MPAPTPLRDKDGVLFPSAVALAKHHGVRTPTVFAHLKKYGHLNFLNRKPVHIREKNSRDKETKIGRFTWRSRVEAAKALQVNTRTLTNYLIHPTKKSAEKLLLLLIAYEQRLAEEARIANNREKRQLSKQRRLEHQKQRRELEEQAQKKLNEKAQT